MNFEIATKSIVRKENIQGVEREHKIHGERGMGIKRMSIRFFKIQRCIELLTNYNGKYCVHIH